MISHHLATLAATTTCPVPKETGSGFFGPIAKPIAAVLAAFYHLVPSYGFAILLLSVVWMVIISPLTLKSTRSMLAMQKIQPEIKKLQEKHKNDRQAFAQAQMDLFKERGVSPFGSCLPTLLPLPVFFALFRVIDGLSHTTKGCATPQYLSPSTKMYHNIVAGHGTLHSFGLDLAKNALSSHSSFLAALPFFVLLLIMGGTQYLQTQQMMSRNPAAADNPQMKMMKYLPIIFTVICIRFPAGVVLYYSMSNVCRIAQQSLMYRYDPKVRTLAKRDVIDVEAFTEEHEEEHRRQRGKGSPGPASGNGGAGGGSPRGGGSKGGSGGGGSGGGLAKRDEPEDAKPARSRFSALFEAAKEQKAQQLEEKSKAKQQARQPASNRSTPRQGKAGGAPAKGGGSPAKPAAKSPAKPAAKAKSAGGANGAQESSGGRGPANGNGSATPAKASNGNGNGNGNGAKAGPPPRTNGGAGRTGAANRTGARSGAKKNRRGR